MAIERTLSIIKPDATKRNFLQSAQIREDLVRFLDSMHRSLCNVGYSPGVSTIRLIPASGTLKSVNVTELLC